MQSFVGEKADEQRLILANILDQLRLENVQDIEKISIQYRK